MAEIAEVLLIVSGGAGSFRRTIAIPVDLNAAPDTRKTRVGREVVENRLIATFRDLYAEATGSPPAGSSAD